MERNPAIDPSVIGAIGETLVETWALQVGITPNQVQRDKHGWDYSMELPRAHSRSGGVSLDLVPCDIRCFVQVKTVMRAENRVQIALSNWSRMAKDPVPWFVVVVILNERLEPDSAFLVHVDREWVARVLKRLRELPESASLNDRYLELDWNDFQRLPKLHGESLRDGICFHVGADVNAYLAEKQRWIDTVGYDEARHLLRVSFSASSEEEMFEMLAEAAIGLRKTLPLEALRATEMRFDVPKEIVAQERDAGTLEFLQREADGTTRITLGRVDGGSSVTLVCDTYRAASVVPALPEKFRMARYVAPFFSATVRIHRESQSPEGGQLSLSWQFSGPEPGATVTLQELDRAARAALMLHESARSPVHLSLRDDRGEGFARTGVRSNAGLNARGFRYWTLVRRLRDVATHFQIDGDTAFDASVIDAQAEAITTLAVAIAGPRDRGRFTGAANIDEVPVHRLAATLAAPYVVLGDQVVGACVALMGAPVWSADEDGTKRFEVVNATVRIMGEFRAPSDEWSLAVVDDLVVRARDELGADGSVLVMFPEAEPDESERAREL